MQPEPAAPRPLIHLSYPAALTSLGALYFIAGKLGLKLAFVHHSATAVWPPTGIALAAFLLLGYRFWPAIFVGALLVNISTHGFATLAGIAAGNTLEGVLGAFLVNRYAGGYDPFQRPQDVFKFAALAGLVSTLVSATIGVTSLCLGGFADWLQYGSIWITWWLGDAVGAFVVAPLLVLWIRSPRLQWSRAQALEAALLLLSVFLAGMLVFGRLLPAEYRNFPLEFLCIAPPVWAAFRFGQREAVTAGFILTMIAIWGTLHGIGPFAKLPPTESLVVMQSFMGFLAVLATAVAAVVSERKRVEDERTQSLNVYINHLDAIVSARTVELEQKNRELERTLGQLRQAQEQLVLQEKMASLGQLTAGIAHEIKNPLNFINNFASLSCDRTRELRQTLAGEWEKIAPVVREEAGRLLDSLERTTSKIEEHGKRADNIVRGMLLHFRGGAGERQSTDVNALLEEYAALAYHGMRAREPSFQVTIQKDFDPSLGTIVAVPQDLGRVFLNLLGNAFYSMHKKGLENRPGYSPVVRLSTRAAGDRVEIRVRDNGEGIPAALLGRIFDPFFTTKPAGEGTGLGLSISYDIVVAQHHGELQVSSEEGSFAEFLVLLPRGSPLCS